MFWRKLKEKEVVRKGDLVVLTNQTTTEERITYLHGRKSFRKS